MAHLHWNNTLRGFEECTRAGCTDSASVALAPPASPISEGPETPGPGYGGPTATSAAGLPVRFFIERSLFHEAFRFLLQKHQRVIVAALRGAVDFGDLAARQHDELMLAAAIDDFEHLIQLTIDRRIDARIAARGTFFRGGAL